MRKARSGITQRAWLFMLEHGGHWTTGELAEQLGEGTDHMDKIVWSMAKGGRATPKRSGYRKNGTAFGVSLRNRIPQGITLQQVLDAVGVRKVIDSSAPAANDSRRKAA